MDGRQVFCCQGEKDVMSQSAAVLNDIAVLHFPEPEERSASQSSGRETPS